MSMRTPRERAMQTLGYELGGWLIATPIYGLVTGQSMAESLALMVAVTVAMLVWSPFHNTVFDHVDLRLTGRVASDRPHRLRIVHACSHEATSIIVTLPVIMAVGGHGFVDGVLVDVGLTLIYAVWAYVWHLAYDMVRPVGRANSGAST